jgi:hypothetical protein
VKPVVIFTIQIDRQETEKEPEDVYNRKAKNPADSGVQRSRFYH